MWGVPMDLIIMIEKMKQLHVHVCVLTFFQVN